MSATRSRRASASSLVEHRQHRQIGRRAAPRRPLGHGEAARVPFAGHHHQPRRRARRRSAAATRSAMVSSHTSCAGRSARTWPRRTCRAGAARTPRARTRDGLSGPGFISGSCAFCSASSASRPPLATAWARSRGALSAIRRQVVRAAELEQRPVEAPVEAPGLLPVDRVQESRPRRACRRRRPSSGPCRCAAASPCRGPPTDRRRRRARAPRPRPRGGADWGAPRRRR